MYFKFILVTPFCESLVTRLHATNQPFTPVSSYFEAPVIDSQFNIQFTQNQKNYDDLNNYNALQYMVVFMFISVFVAAMTLESLNFSMDFNAPWSGQWSSVGVAPAWERI